MPLVSLLLPTMGDSDYLRLFFWSLKHASKRDDIQVCVSCHGHFPDVQTYLRVGRSLKVVDDVGDPDVGVGQNRCIDMADGDYVATTNDDIVFLPGWDDFDGRIAPDRWLGWELIEPRFGSFPPTSDAGDSPSTFSWDIACMEAAGRNGPATPNRPAGLFLFHRSLVTPGTRYAEGWGPYAGQDTDLIHRMFKAHPRLLFGSMGTCLFHFQGGAVSRRPHLRMPGEDFHRRFTEAYGIEPPECYSMIRERTARLLAEEPSRWPL